MIPIPFGSTPEGTSARLFSLGNSSGFRVEITDFGATLVRLFAPDRHGRLGDVVLGFDRADDYARHPFFLGGTIGRYGNRIARGRFTLDGKVHQLSLNNGPAEARCHLHGGLVGFHQRPWAAEFREESGGSLLRLKLRSPDGEEGYPGNLEVTVTYSVPANRNELRIEYEATTDRATPFNPTNHAYWNLRGEVPGDVLGHILQIEASAYTPINAALIPRGHHEPVGSSPDVAAADPGRGIVGTPFDFRTPHALGARLAADHEQLRLAGGYDHNYVLGAGMAESGAEGPESRGMNSGAADESASGSRPSTLDSRLHRPAATVLEPDSGRVMEVLTTEPGLQLYSGNFLDGTWPGKGGRIHAKHTGFCLETQHFPDSPNQPAFPSTILHPGEVFRSTTIYRFGTATA